MFFVSSGVFGQDEIWKEFFLSGLDLVEDSFFREEDMGF